MFNDQANSPKGLAASAEGAIADEEIIRRVLAGDAASFELIMRRYNRLLFRVARSIAGNDAEAEDVLQETYLHAFEHLRHFEGRSRFSTWLTRIAMHEAGRRRKRHRLRFVFPAIEGNDFAGADPIGRDGLEEASREELRRLLVAAIDSLPRDLRVVFTLRIVERLSTEETAECLNLSQANVKVRLHRARSALRQWIDDRIGEESRRLYAFGGEHCDRVVRAVMERLARDPG